MKHLLVLSAFVLSSSGLAVQAQSDGKPAIDPKIASAVERILNDRLASQEARIRKLENDMAALQRLSATLSGSNAALAQSHGTYIIQDGDTLGKIADHHGVSREELLAANNLNDGDDIYIGDELIIPGSKAPAPAPAPAVASNKPKAGPPAPPTTAPRASGEVASATTPSKPQEPKKQQPAAPQAPATQAPAKGHDTYVVRFGDTLSGIARKHGTTVAAIMQANGMSQDRIEGNQKLIIPKPGATVAQAPAQPQKPAAQKPQQQEQQPAAAPAPATATATADAEATPYRADETYGLYTVQKGDTLYSLARDFITSEAEIRRLNAINGSSIYVGQDLTVPTSKYYKRHNIVAEN